MGASALRTYPGPISLVCIDEEQRFGAELKESLVSRARGATYLTATPIPRTLVHLPLDVVRIEGWPTHHIKPKVRCGIFEWRVAAKMIRREKKRGGQTLWIVTRRTGAAQIARTLSTTGRCLTLTGKDGLGALRAAGEKLRGGTVDILVATVEIGRAHV